MRFFFALLLISLGCAYLFQRDTVLRLNAYMRDKIFHDANVLLHGRRVGSALIMLGLFCLAIAFLIGK